MSSYKLMRSADGWRVSVGQGSMLVFAHKREAVRVIRDAEKLLNRKRAGTGSPVNGQGIARKAPAKPASGAKAG